MAVDPVFVVARNPEPGSTLPYLIRLPLGANGLVLKARDSWPRTARVYCHRAVEWPDDAEELERVPREVVRATRRRHRPRPSTGTGKPVADRLHEAQGRARGNLLADRAHCEGREAHGARPGRRASWLDDFVIQIDTRERYPYKFPRQQASTTRRALHVGDYGVLLDDEVVAAVERKSLDNLVHGLVDGSMQSQVADLRDDVARCDRVSRPRCFGINPTISATPCRSNACS